MENEVALAEDVLTQILINLPVKSLVRFRCVSKYWYALIKSPNFVSWHLKHDCKKECLLQNRGKVLSFHDLDSPDVLVSPNVSVPFDIKFYEFLGTCNGLVCLLIDKIVALCNPALREFEVLATPLEEIDPCVSFSIGSGFGFDVDTNAYKVVRLWCTNHDTDDPHEDSYMRVDVYNSNTNSWRSINGVAPLVNYCPALNVLLDGACHWNVCDDFILSFDLSTEVFQQFNLPKFKDNDSEHFTSIMVVDQCLALVRFTDHRKFYHIWVMEEYGVKESWTKKFVIGPYDIRWPHLSLKNGWLLVETYDWKMGYCALHGRETKKFHCDWAENNALLAAVFTESLISLKQVIIHRKKD